MSELKILGLCGSLRKGSINRKLMHEAAKRLPAGLVFEAAEWRDIPPFDGDLFEQGFPESVLTLRRQIAEADGVLIVSPEYNFSVPGVFKNALDWVSRGSDQPFARKPVALLSATPGPTGGARVQYDMRRILLFMNAMVLQKPEVFVGHAADKFDSQGRCSDEVTLKFLTDQMGAFKQWITEVARMKAPA